MIDVASIIVEHVTNLFNKKNLTEKTFALFVA